MQPRDEPTEQKGNTSLVGIGYSVPHTFFSFPFPFFLFFSFRALLNHPGSSWNQKQVTIQILEDSGSLAVCRLCRLLRRTRSLAPVRPAQHNSAPGSPGPAEDDLIPSEVGFCQSLSVSGLCWRRWERLAGWQTHSHTYIVVYSPSKASPLPHLSSSDLVCRFLAILASLCLLLSTTAPTRTHTLFLPIGHVARIRTMAQVNRGIAPYADVATGPAASSKDVVARQQQEPASPGLTTANSEDFEADQQQEPAPRDLTRFDVPSFMVNRMIGTDIATSPPIVLWAWGNQHMALWVWFAGGLFSLVWCVRPSGGRATVSLTMIQPSSSFT